MALYRLEAKIIGRRARNKNGEPIPGKSVSVVAKAAYRAGQALKDERAEKTFNYRSRAQEVVHSEIMAPATAPEWLKPDRRDGGSATQRGQAKRERLWNVIEKVEKRSDSQLAREFIAALPRELKREERIELVRGWCEEEFVSKGFVVDVAVHKSKDGKNPHAHILCVLRPVEGEGFGKKPDTAGKFNGRGAAGIGAKNDLDGWRASWEKHVNAALEKAGRKERVDRRSLKDRGIDRTPEPKIGVDAMAMKRKGKESQNCDQVAWVKLENEARPFVRDIERHGEVRQVGGGVTFWQKAAVFVTRLRERGREMVQDTWEKFVRSRRRQEPPSPEPDLNPSR